MSDNSRNLLAIVMLILLSATAFAAGYFTNDFIELQTGGTLVREPEEFDLFWEAWGHIQGSFIGELPTQQTLTYGAIRGAMSQLNDPYTVFIEPPAREEERETLQGTFGGIGANLSRPEEGGPIVLEPIPGNPAAVAGILSGDVLLKIDGVEITADMTVQQVADMIRGEKSTTVTLTVVHSGETTPVDITIERADILIPSVAYRLLNEDNTIGYIQLTRFSGESSNEIATAIAALQEQGAEKYILDLRGNGGGLLDAAVEVADHFLDAGTILSQQSKAESDNREYTADTDILLAMDVPLVLLVDGGTASASEIVAGALQDQERAPLVGSSHTFGKGSVQLVFDLSDGSSVHVTSARWYTPDGHQIDQSGLQPDFLVEVTQEDLDNGRDVVLNQAITYLQNGS